LRRDAGIGPNTVNKDISILKSALRKARVWEYSAPTLDQLASVRRLKREKRHPFFFQKKVVADLLKGLDGFWRTVVLIGVYAGLRRGELLSLRWEDVDFVSGMLKVVPRDGWSPKDREPREIPMCKALRKHLKAWRAACGRGEKVLPWDKPFGAFSSAFTRILRNAGIKRGSLHALRHTFASWLAIAGVDTARIAKLMGHSSIVTTQIYTHLMPSDLKDVVEKLPSLDDDPEEVQN
ncbi:MAG: site-specific integrase, partial [Elusimicrobiota bacterium]